MSELFFVEAVSSTTSLLSAKTVNVYQSIVSCEAVHCKNRTGLTEGVGYSYWPCLTSIACSIIAGDSLDCQISGTNRLAIYKNFSGETKRQINY